MSRAIILLCLATLGGHAVAIAQPIPPALHTAVTLKKYQATITRKDDRNNTKTFTDYCDAAGTAEAQRIFEGRFPNDRVSGVREVG